MYKDPFSKSRCLFFKSRRETTVFDQFFFREGLNTRWHRIYIPNASENFSKVCSPFCTTAGTAWKKIPMGGTQNFLQDVKRKLKKEETVVSLLDLKNTSWFTKSISWYMTRNTWELKLNSTILTHSKSKLTLIVSILIVNLWIWIIKLHLWYFVTFGVAYTSLEKSTTNRFLAFFLKLLSHRLDYQPLFGKMSPHS